MSMPDTLTIYKVPFGEDGFLLSFIEPPSGDHDRAEYVKMSTYAGDMEDLRFHISELLGDIDYLKRRIEDMNAEQAGEDI